MANPLDAPTYGSPYDAVSGYEAGQSGVGWAWFNFQLFWANAAPGAWGIMQDSINALQGI